VAVVVCGTAAVWFRAASNAWARPEFLSTAIDLGREALSLPGRETSTELDLHQRAVEDGLLISK
jgi:hypothetical protein